MKVLFVGNSYTYFNDMPQIFENLARENGHDVTVHSVTRGGRRLITNLNPDDACTQELNALLSENKYDVSILQEQSLGALLKFESFLEGARGVSLAIGAKRTILYSTWARDFESPTLAENGWEHEKMALDIAAAYNKVASDIGAEVSHVGLAFLKAERLCTSSLYKDDKSHPSYLGSVVAAMVHYATVFGEAPKATDTIELTNEEKNCILSVLSSL